MPSAVELLERIRALPLGETRIMEVCGTHTMAIAEAGLRSLLPGNVKLLSGPGCPVCVTPAEVIDAVLALSMEKNLILASYGDMLRVPGSRPGDSLQRRRALGADVRVCYSPMDALDIAEANPGKEIVFLGVGFETTAPGTAAAVLSARERGLKSFSVWSMLKTVEPALRALMGTEGFNVQGFLCPGHVATILGAEGFRFLPEEYKMPAVIAGFEREDILLAVYKLLRQIAEGRPRIENEYPRAVRQEGNVLARRIMAQCFTPRKDRWRGLGEIADSGLGLREELEEFDAEKKFVIERRSGKSTPACRCGEVLRGIVTPVECPLFGKACIPTHAVGPCMVSVEGVCAAWYKYGRGRLSFGSEWE